MRMDFPRLSDWEIAQPSIHEVHQTLEETVPTSIRKAEHFIAYLQSLIAFFKVCWFFMASIDVRIYTCTSI